MHHQLHYQLVQNGVAHWVRNFSRNESVNVSGTQYAALKNDENVGVGESPQLPLDAITE